MEAKKGKPVYAERTSYARAARGVHEARPVPACSRVRYAPIFCRRRHWSGKASPNASFGPLLSSTQRFFRLRFSPRGVATDGDRCLACFGNADYLIERSQPQTRQVHRTGFGDCSHSTWGECQVLESEVKSPNHVTRKLIFSILGFCTLSDSDPK